MAITKESIGNEPLDAFITEVRSIYEGKDAKRSVWDIWLHANNHAAGIGEEIRKNELGKTLIDQIADFAMWPFTLVGKIQRSYGSRDDTYGIEESTIRIDNTLSALIWNKYPGMCPVCFWRRIKAGMEKQSSDFDKACDCLLHPIESRDQNEKRIHIQELYNYAKKHDENKPQSVNLWQNMFSTIYESNLRHLRLEDIAFHLLEEVGEVSDAMARMYTYRKDNFISGEPSWRRVLLENELADVSSWLFTLVNSLAFMPRVAREYQLYRLKQTALVEEEITLSGIIWNRYGSNDLKKMYCPHCEEAPVCKCPIVLVSTDELLAEAKGYVTNELA